MNVADNLAKLAAAIERLDAGVLAVAPEGTLSGYLPISGFVAALDGAVTERAIAHARSMVKKSQIHLVVGACVFADGAWRNSSFYMGPQGHLE